MKPRKMTSSFSNREKMRRTPFSRRTSRSTSLRRLYIFPGGTPGLARRTHRREPQPQRQLAGRVALVGPIHHQRQRLALDSQALEQLAPLGRIRGLARRQRTRHRCAILRGNQMHLGGPARAGFAEGLGPVLFRAPVPPG